MATTITTVTTTSNY